MYKADIQFCCGERLPLINLLAYGASEGFFGVIASIHTDEYLLLPTNVFFEFIKEEDIQQAQPKTLLISELEPGHRYELVCTTHAGLVRYRMGDVINCTRFLCRADDLVSLPEEPIEIPRIPLISLAYRVGTLLSVFGEKTNEQHLINALQQTVWQWREQGIPVNSYEFASYPRLDVFPAQYVIFLELIEDQEHKIDAQQLQILKNTVNAEVEQELCKANQNYQNSRSSTKLGPLNAILTEIDVHGPGVQSDGVMTNKRTWFQVDVKNAGNRPVQASITDPQGQQNTVSVSIERKAPGEFFCEYDPREPGPHRINVNFDGQPAPNSPYPVNVKSSLASDPTRASDRTKFDVFGRGIEPRGVHIDDIADFYVITGSAGEGIMKPTVTEPDGSQIPCRVRKLNKTTYECDYVPTHATLHTVNITYDGTPVPRSPFLVEVGPKKDSRIRTFGPGLEGGVVGYPAVFVIETHGETGLLDVVIKGPSKVRVERKDNGDGSINVTYWPTAFGKYAVHVLDNGKDIPLSPFMVQIVARTMFAPNKVIAYGAGIERTGQIVHQLNKFTIDTHLAGEAPLHVSAIDQERQSVNVQVSYNGDGTYTCQYTPQTLLYHWIFINFGSVAIPNSPFQIWPIDPSKVHVYGPGVERDVKINNLTHFFVDYKEAGPGNILVVIKDAYRQDVSYNIVCDQDRIFRIEYTPELPGVHFINVLFCDHEIPISPIQVDVESRKPLWSPKQPKIRAYGPGLSRGTVNEPANFIIDTNDADNIQLDIKIEGPSALTIDFQYNDYGRPQVTYYPKVAGNYNINILYAGKHIPGSPFAAIVDLNIQDIRCYGPGICSMGMYRMDLIRIYDIIASMSYCF
ncbi:unnamed protein product [Rotaria sordida]|uniref:Uncharacterized protein n=2 Tax=Rotaria sordida TaxID=392033 RepID=A0A814DXT6_9BILA|nr:unnamed protein product [Rotaria sordida]